MGQCICGNEGAEDQVHIRAAISPRQGAAGPIAVHQTANEGYVGVIEQQPFVHSPGSAHIQAAQNVIKAALCNFIDMEEQHTRKVDPSEASSRFARYQSKLQAQRFSLPAGDQSTPTQQPGDTSEDNKVNSSGVGDENDEINATIPTETTVSKANDTNSPLVFETLEAMSQHIALPEHIPY